MISSLLSQKSRFFLLFCLQPKEVIMYSYCPVDTLLKYDVILQLCFPEVRLHGGLFEGAYMQT